MSTVEQFLDKIGKRVETVSDLEVGNIVATHFRYDGYTYHEIRIHYVNHVVKSYSGCGKMLGFPHVVFKEPTIGFTLDSGGFVGRIHLNTPLAFQPGRTCWSERQYRKEHDEWLKGWGIKKESSDEIFFPLWRLFSDTTNDYYRLGQLIPLVEVPHWSFLTQTTNNPNALFNYVDAVKGDLQLARELYEKIKTKSEAVR